MINSSNSAIDEIVDLKMKLKESYAMNEELKASFRKNLLELESTLRECVDDKEKVMLKK